MPLKQVSTLFLIVLLDKGHGRCVLALAVALALWVALQVEVLQLAVGVGAVGVEAAAGRQVHVHGLEGPGVVHAPGHDEVVHRHALGSGDVLHLKAVEVLPLRGVVAPIGLICEKLAPVDADIAAHGHREAVDEVLARAVKFLEALAQSREKGGDHAPQAVEHAVEVALVRQAWWACI